MASTPKSALYGTEVVVIPCTFFRLKKMDQYHLYGTSLFQFWDGKTSPRFLETLIFKYHYGNFDFFKNGKKAITIVILDYDNLGV